MFGKKKIEERIVELERALRFSEQERHRLANENAMLKHELQKKNEPSYFG